MESSAPNGTGGVRQRKKAGATSAPKAQSSSARSARTQEPPPQKAYTAEQKRGKSLKNYPKSLRSLEKVSGNGNSI